MGVAAEGGGADGRDLRPVQQVHHRVHEVDAHVHQHARARLPAVQKPVGLGYDVEPRAPATAPVLHVCAVDASQFAALDVILRQRS